ncbi:MAG: N-acetylglucosamine-6-phosphate deacetylase [Clostridia bacterium]|nr:N-acetylglucosamine-6-phosphate deacetylase [Clostridia bacterium]
MLYTNADVFLPDGFRRCAFRAENGVFAAILPDTDGADGVDLAGAKVLPGLVDLHVHGCMGADCSDGDPAGLHRIAAYLAAHGITSFAPTTTTTPLAALSDALAAIRDAAEHPTAGEARIAGAHMEGPFLSERRKGAQNGMYLRQPDADLFAELQAASGNRIRIVDVAPELPGAIAFAKTVSGHCTVSAAHTDADYDTAKAFFAAGATHLTHLFNAMPPIHHRAPGVIGAASETDSVVAELIADGFHVHPSAVRMAFRLFPDRICLASDALRCCGMPDGAYSLGGQPIVLADGVARLSDGTLAGSATNLFACMRRAIRFGIPEAAAIRAATAVPARQLGLYDRIGSIEVGKAADFLVCDQDLRLRRVALGGTFL